MLIVNCNEAIVTNVYKQTYNFLFSFGRLSIVDLKEFCFKKMINITSRPQVNHLYLPSSLDACNVINADSHDWQNHLQLVSIM